MARRQPDARTRHRKVPHPVARAVGLRVRAIRVEANWSFDAFVEETGLGRGYISELERGLVVPTVVALAKIAAALEVTVADLVLGDSPRERLFDVARRAGEKEIALMLRRAEAA